MSEGKKKRSKLKGLLVTVGGALVLAGAGAAGGVYAAKSGLVGGTEKGIAAKPKEEAKAEAAYFGFQQSFTSNLRDSGSFAQIALSVATTDNPRAADAVKANEAALRSVVLLTLAEEDGVALATTQGKQALQKKLRSAMDAELKARTGQGGIDSVYFTSFVIQ